MEIISGNEDLKPCPCCGSGAYFDMLLPANATGQRAP